MKNSTAFAAAGLISLFAWGAAFAQSPSQIPVGAGANVTRQPAGSRFRSPDQSSASCRRARSRRGADGLLLDRLLCRRRLRRLLRLDLYRVRHDRLGVAEPEPRGCDGRRLRRLQLSGEPEFRRSAWKATFKAIHSSANFYYPTFDVAPSVQQNWLASLNGRLGIAYDRALFYAIGGAAWGQGSVTVTPGILLFPPSLPPVSRTANLSGWDVGAGVEYAFDPRWVGRLEYRYYNFGSFNASNVGAYLPLHVQTSVNTVRAGFAYLFGAPAPVVVTKY